MSGTGSRTGRRTRRTASSSQRPTLFESARRRALLRVLADRDEEVELDELARSVAAEEYDCAPGAVDDETYQRVLVTLDRTHLPRLVEAGLATVDRSDGVFVRPDRDAIAAL